MLDVTEINRLLLQLLSCEIGQGKNINMGMINNVSREKLYEEAAKQAVLPLIVHADTGHSDLNAILCMAHAIQSTKEHCRLHDILTAYDIPYTIIKGVAAASYYPNPKLRAMGDVDFLIDQSDIDDVTKLLLKEGFTMLDENHVCERIFTKEGSVWELHWDINGVPQGEVGDRIHESIKDIIKDSVLLSTEYGVCRVNNTFHHGLVLLIHMAHHLLSSGIGLRHLCDWIVFTESVKDDEFRMLYKNVLESVGLWRFACLMALVSNHYLGTRLYSWIDVDFKESMLSDVMSDILNNGNLGVKNTQRAYQGILLSDCESGRVSQSGLKQFFKTLKVKTCSTYPWSKKNRVTCLIGAWMVCFSYVRLVRQGKRDRFSIMKTFTGTKKRRKIYRKIKLFEV